jgi:hypothetical protein
MAGVKNSELKNGMERHSLLMLNAALKREFSLNVKTIIKLKNYGTHSRDEWNNLHPLSIMIGFAFDFNSIS